MSAGLPEAKAKAASHKVKVGHSPFIGNGKATATSKPERLVKTAFDEATSELLAAHFVSTQVMEVIQGYIAISTPEAKRWSGAHSEDNNEIYTSV